MKRIRYIITILALTLALQALAQSIVERKGIENPDKWIAASFAKGKLPQFSFTRDGVPSEKFIKGWEYSKNKLSAPQPGA
ncbi:MAG: alpha-galactosidase, partial [Bacteroidales bacterium]|nr:alpha-galactosidase [Bacteroidales bacterium]